MIFCEDFSRIFRGFCEDFARIFQNFCEEIVCNCKKKDYDFASCDKLKVKI